MHARDNGLLAPKQRNRGSLHLSDAPVRTDRLDRGVRSWHRHKLDWTILNGPHSIVPAGLTATSNVLLQGTSPYRAGILSW